MEPIKRPACLPLIIGSLLGTVIGAIILCWLMSRYLISIDEQAIATDFIIMTPTAIFGGFWGATAGLIFACMLPDKRK